MSRPIGRNLALFARVVLCAYALATGGCRYAGPLAGGASEIREGTLPSQVRRLMRDAGGARPAEAILPATARADSAAIYLIVVDEWPRAVPTAQVVVLPHSASTPNYPAGGWEPVDAFGVYSRRLIPGEYVVFVRDPYHWAARRRVRLEQGAIDTLLAVMRTGM